VALRFSIEEIVPNEIEDGSPKEFGSVKLPKMWRSAVATQCFPSRSRS